MNEQKAAKAYEKFMSNQFRRSSVGYSGISKRDYERIWRQGFESNSTGETPPKPLESVWKTLSPAQRAFHEGIESRASLRIHKSPKFNEPLHPPVWEDQTDIIQPSAMSSAMAMAPPPSAMSSAMAPPPTAVSSAMAPPPFQYRFGVFPQAATMGNYPVFPSMDQAATAAPAMAAPAMDDAMDDEAPEYDGLDALYDASNDLPMVPESESDDEFGDIEITERIPRRGRKHPLGITGPKALRQSAEDKRDIKEDIAEMKRRMGRGRKFTPSQNMRGSG